MKRVKEKIDYVNCSNVDKYSKNVISILLRYYQTPIAFERVFISIFFNLPQHIVRKTCIKMFIILMMKFKITYCVNIGTI